MVMLGHDGCEACAPEIARLEAECAALRKDVSALKRTYMADFLKVAVDALDDVEYAGSHPVGAPDSVKRRAQDIGKRLRAMAVWLDKITGAAFFGATAPDDSTMQFTITVTAAEWREMRELVGVDSTPSPQPLRPRSDDTKERK